MEITADQKSFVLFQLRNFPETSRNTMERMFQNHLLPFIETHEFEELKSFVTYESVGDAAELKQFAINFLVADAKRQFPQYEDLFLLSRIKPEHVEVGSQFAGLLLTLVIQALITDQQHIDYVLESSTNLDEEISQLLAEETNRE